LVISILFRTFAKTLIGDMDKNSNVRVVGFLKGSYSKEWLDSINDRERSETALADGDTVIYEDLRDFQDTVLNTSSVELKSHYWYFLND
jgi:hypothetical protein